ncbi:MAG: hypothetical protein ACJ8NS_10480 [Chthoniobacterales bacterium]|jgi:hypothetical protein
MNEPRFYFALPRLLAKFRGGNSGRAEKNVAEAWVVGGGIYLVSYLYFAGYISGVTSWWLCGLLLVVLAFLVWLFWLLAFYLNSLILKLLRGAGLLRALPVRRCQSVLLMTIGTAMAVALVQRGSFGSEIGAIWLTATAMNLAAAAILALGNGEPAR